MKPATQLEGWKEIAWHFRVNERTARRWAELPADPLPVYYTRHNGHVKATVEELDAWQRRQTVPVSESVH